MSHFNSNVAILSEMFGGIQYVNRREAVTGKLASDNTVDPDVTSGLSHPEIWVRPGGARQAVPAINLTVTDLIADMPVEIGEDTITGKTTVIRVHPTKGPIFLGDATASANTPRRVAAVNNDIIPSRNFEPGRVTLATAATLTIKAEPFPYRDTAGAEKWWSGGALLDLTSSVPGSSNEHVLVRIALDNDATTPVLVATSGTARDKNAKFQRAEAFDIALPIHYEPLAVIRLVNGDTTFTEDRVWDDRRFFVTHPRAPYVYIAKTANYTAIATDEIINCDASGGSFTITLPTAVGITGKRYDVRKSDSSSNAVTIDASGAETINGSLTAVIAIQYVNLTLISDGANWMVM